MKIVAIVHNYLPKLGGAETILHSNLTGFLENKYVDKAIVITSLYKDTPRQEVIDGVDIRRFKSFVLLNNRLHLPSLDLFKTILNIIKTEKPDQIHTVTRFSMHTMIGLLLAKWKGVRVVHEEYLAGFVKGESKLINLAAYAWDKLVVKFCLSQADQIVCLSESVKKFLVEDIGLNAQKMVVIQSGCHLKADPQSYRQKLENVKTYNLFWAARLVALKNPLLTLQSILLLRQKRQDFDFFMAGEGIQKKEVEDFIEQNQMGLYTHYLGRLNPEEMSKQFQKSHLFISSSTMEGLCLSVLEAVFNTNLVVSSRTGGPDELLYRVQDSFVELDQLQPEVFAKKYDFILNNQSKLIDLYQVNKDFVVSYYTIQRAQRQYHDFVLKSIAST